MWQTIRNNAVSLISLVVALSALTYNTWRNELTEQNRNVRVAGFETLKELAALQVQVDNTTYRALGDQETIAAWSRVLFIQDLAALTSPELEVSAGRLRDVWGASVSELDDEDANRRMTDEIRAMRATVMETLRRLR